MVASQVNLAQVAQAYTAIREHRAAKKRAFDKEDADLEADQDKLKALMLDVMNAGGLQSVRTDYGTIYRTEKVKPSAADWSAVYAWIAENPERFELLERRLKSTFVKQFMEENDGRLPPGVNAHREYEVAVRRPNGQGASSNPNGQGASSND